MNEKIKKLIENSITVKESVEGIDLENRKDEVSDKFYSFMNEKGISKEEIDITSISDMTITYLIKGVDKFVFYQNYSFSDEKGEVGFDDMDLQKKEIEDVKEEIPEVAEKEELVKQVSEAIKNKKFIEASNLLEQVFAKKLEIRIKRRPDITLSESAKAKGKKILDEVLSK